MHLPIWPENTTNMPGNRLVLVDSDALIGLISESDVLHLRCVSVLKHFSEYGYKFYIPLPVLLEASTTLARAIGRMDLAKRLLSDYSKVKQDRLNEDNVLSTISKLYDPKSSKKNTPFDYYVAALAGKNGVKYIFSFDKFYRKQGFVLAKELIEKN